MEEAGKTIFTSEYIQVSMDKEKVQEDIIEPLQDDLEMISDLLNEY